jgi:diguanylate cyclase (GGDEF)-like protein/PAS domain S-box-containing protein
MVMEVLLPARRRRADGTAGAEDRVLRLFAADGPFARFRGAALCVRRSGRVLAANGDGMELAGFFYDGRTPELADIVERVLTEGVARTATVTLPGGEKTLEVTVLPVGPGPGAAGAEEAQAELAVLLCRDVTLDRNLRAALIESRQRYRDLVDISSDFAWETGKDGTFVFVSPRGALGYRADELVDRDPRGLVLDHPGGGDLPFSTRAALEDVEIPFRRADGGPASVLVTCVPILGENGEWQGARGVCRDVTEARERDAALARARVREQVLAYIVDQIRDEIRPENMMNAAAGATAKALGAAGCRIYHMREGKGFTVAAEFGTASESAEAPLGGLSEGSEHCAAEVGGWRVLAMSTRYRHAVNGAISLWRKAEEAPWNEDDLVLLTKVASQLGIAAEQLAVHEELERLSRTDTLTGLLNRRVFFEEVRRCMTHSARTGRAGALCFIDLDNFKPVNDRHGHAQGDRVLQALGAHLRENTRVNDLAARLGGDEFAIWLEETEEDGAVAKAKALLSSASDLTELPGDAERPLGLSLGIAVHHPDRPERPEELMARADEAMYAVKRAGKGGFRIAEPAPGAAASEAAR